MGRPPRFQKHKNPLLRPKSGESDLLPGWLRDGIDEMLTTYVVRDPDEYYADMRGKGGRIWQLAHLVDESDLADREKEYLVTALRKISEGVNAETAFFPRFNPPPKNPATNFLVKRLVHLIWVGSRRKLRPSLRARGLSLVTDFRASKETGKPYHSWPLARNQDEAFEWVAAFLTESGMKMSYKTVCERYYAKGEPFPSAVPLPDDSRYFE